MAEAKLEARDGRTAILITAERMFAIYGLHGASLRQISEEAGQKNTSAIQYHFGSRDKLIEAVFAMRMTRINNDPAMRCSRMDLQRAWWNDPRISPRN